MSCCFACRRLVVPTCRHHVRRGRLVRLRAFRHGRTIPSGLVPQVQTVCPAPSRGAAAPCQRRQTRHGVRLARVSDPPKPTRCSARKRGCGAAPVTDRRRRSGVLLGPPLGPGRPRSRRLGSQPGRPAERPCGLLRLCRGQLIEPLLVSTLGRLLPAQPAQRVIRPPVATEPVAAVAADARRHHAGRPDRHWAHRRTRPSRRPAAHIGQSRDGLPTVRFERFTCCPRSARWW